MLFDGDVGEDVVEGVVELLDVGGGAFVVGVVGADAVDEGVDGVGAFLAVGGGEFVVVFVEGGFDLGGECVEGVGGGEFEAGMVCASGWGEDEERGCDNVWDDRGGV